MTLFKQTRERLAQYGRIFMLGGPLGVAYEVRQARITRRMQALHSHMDRERELHRQQMAQLNHELNQLISAQLGINIAAAQFRAYCDKQAGSQP